MKKALFSLAVAGLLTASANASTLSLQWQGQPGVDKISLAPSDTAVIDVFLEFGPNANNNVSGVFFSMEPGLVRHVSNSTTVPNWSASNEIDAVNLLFGDSQFAVGSPSPGSADDLTNNGGTVLMGSFVIHYEDILSPNGTEFEVAFDAPGGLGDPLGANNQIVDSAGQLLSFTLNVGAQLNYAAYSGYWTFGKGSPGVQQMASSIPRDPLIITKIPEPASLALLALGGFAAIMRRRS